jgi:hypothetical protein
MEEINTAATTATVKMAMAMLKMAMVSTAKPLTPESPSYSGDSLVPGIITAVSMAF